MSVAVMHDLDAEEVQRALSQSLGHYYEVSMTSGSTLRVRQNPLAWAVVEMKWSPDRTTFEVRPGRLPLMSPYNTIYIVPVVRRALQALEWSNSTV